MSAVFASVCVFQEGFNLFVRANLDATVFQEDRAQPVKIAVSKCRPGAGTDAAADRRGTQCKYVHKCEAERVLIRLADMLASQIDGATS